MLGAVHHNSGLAHGLFLVVTGQLVAECGVDLDSGVQHIKPHLRLEVLQAVNAHGGVVHLEPLVDLR